MATLLSTMVPGFNAHLVLLGRRAGPLYELLLGRFWNNKLKKPKIPRSCSGATGGYRAER